MPTAPATGDCLPSPGIFWRPEQAAAAWRACHAIVLNEASLLRSQLPAPGFLFFCAGGLLQPSALPLARSDVYARKLAMPAAPAPARRYAGLPAPAPRAALPPGAVS